MVGAMQELLLAHLTARKSRLEAELAALETKHTALQQVCGTATCTVACILTCAAYWRDLET